MEDESNLVEPQQSILPAEDSFINAETLSALIGSLSLSSSRNYIQPSDTLSKGRVISPPEENNKSFGFLYASILETNDSIKKLASNINSVQSSLFNYYSVDRQQLIDQQKREKEFIDYKLKTGVEGILEAKLQNSIQQPVDKIVPKVDNLFSTISTSIASLFGGFFTADLASSIEKNSDKNLNDLVDVKNKISSEFDDSYDILSDVKVGLNIFYDRMNEIVKTIKDFVNELNFTKLLFPSNNEGQDSPDKNNDTPSPPGKSPPAEDNKSNANQESPISPSTNPTTGEKTTPESVKPSPQGAPVVPLTTPQETSQAGKTDSPSTTPFQTLMPPQTAGLPSETPIITGGPVDARPGIEMVSSLPKVDTPPLPLTSSTQEPQISSIFNLDTLLNIGDTKLNMPINMNNRYTGEQNMFSPSTSFFNTSLAQLNLAYNSKDINYIFGGNNRIPEINIPVKPRVIAINNSSTLAQTPASQSPPSGEDIPYIPSKDASPYSWLALSIYNVTPDLA